MRKFLVVVLLAVLIGAVVSVVAIPTPPGYNPGPVVVQDKSKGTTATGPKITGINNPASYGSGTGSTSTPGKAPVNQYYYVVSSEGYLAPDGKTKLAAGATFSSDTQIDSKEGVTDINYGTYQFTKAYAGQYTYQGEKKFTYEKTNTQQADNFFEKYKVTTTVIITTDSEGNVHKTYDEQTSICGAGLKKCDENYKPVPGSHITVEETTTSVTKPLEPGQKGTPETRSVLTERTRIIYGTDGNEKAKMTTTYTESEKGNVFSTRMPRDVTVKGNDDKIYYEATVDPNTGITTVVNHLDDLKGLSAYEQRELREQIVATGALGFKGAYDTLTFGQTVGRFIKAYNEYAGLRQITSIFWPKYDEEVQARKAKIQQQFCLAAGITNCVTSTICGTIYKIKADNILAGRGPGGSYVSSASLNAERSLPIDVEGMTRQQLIDLFGNSTVIKGVWINLTDPNFNPKILGVMRLRLYHVQYSVTNNAEGKKDLNYNIVFKKVPQEFNSSYGTPVGSARWWKSGQTISNLQSARDDVYKFSGTAYSDVCLTFDPKLPSGHAAFSQLVGELCVPFAEYAGGPTEISVPSNATQQAAAAGPSAAVSETPGALV